MGALTANWERGGDRVRLNKRPSHCSFANFRVCKKSRFSETHRDPGSVSIFSSISAFSRISLYPEAKSPFPRQPHAPCRIIKPGLSRFDCTRDLGTAKENSATPKMWSSLVKKFDLAKQGAFAALRYFRKSDSESEEEVKYDDSSVEGVKYDDSSVEEVKYDDSSGEGVKYDDSSVEEVKYDDSSVEEVVVIEDDNGGEKTVQDRNLHACFSSMVAEINDDSLAVESAEKLLNSLSLDGDVVDVSGVAAYKKLLESAERRDSKLESLGFEIELNRKKCRAIRDLQTVKTPKERPVKVPYELFAPLSKDDEAEVKRALASGMIVAFHEKSNIEITGKILQCLAPLSWLNDEVINLYIELLKERESREPKKFLKCHFFNTFFYKKLVGGAHGYKYTAVRRWTSEKKLGYCLSSCDKIFVPIHKEAHWCLAVISNKDQKFQYLDSLKGKDHGVLSALARYYVEEVKDKNGEDIDVSNWEQEVVDDLPEQKNGSDCGMFMLKYMDFYSRGLGLCFDQRHMPYFRLRTAKEILRLRAD